jgi:predicted permease
MVMRGVRLSIRQLLKTPAWSAAVVGTLGLGIGANTAVFSLVNGVLLRSLPVKHPSELVLFRNVDGQGGRLSRAGENNGSIDPVTGRNASTSFSLLAFERLHAHHPALSDVFAYAPFNQVNLLVDGQPETIPVGQLVSGDYYTGLGVSAVAGRITGSRLDFAAAGQMPAPPTLVADPGGQGENDRRRQYAQSLGILMGLVGLVLLAACVNVANLLIARGAARRREIALRLALGANRAQIVRQLLAESLLLASLGAALGVLVAYSSRGLLVALRQFGGAPAVLDLPLDGTVLSFTIAIAAGTALVCGLAPAIRATRIDLTNEFQGGARLVGHGRTRFSQRLMVLQIALSVVLLVGTGLFVGTLRHLQQIDPGFNTTNLILFRIDAASAGYAPEQFAPLNARIQEQLERIPGVRAATYSRVALLSGGRANRDVSVPGSTLLAGGSMAVNINGLAPNFFRALEVPILAGRSFNDHDQGPAPQAAIVNQRFVRDLFGTDDPIGRRIAFSATPTAAAAQAAIVGVVSDMKYTGLRQAVPPTIYLPATQMVEGTATYYVRSTADPAAIGSAIRAAVRAVDPTLPVNDLRTQEEQVDRLTAQEVLFARLSGFFGVVTLILAGVGLYGLLSYLVLRRTAEIGLRLALGARPVRVLKMILGESFALVGLGLVLGVVVAFGASRFIESMLFDVSPADPLTYGSVGSVIIAVALLASLLPAFRAARVDPMTAFRTE